MRNSGHVGVSIPVSLLALLAAFSAPSVATDDPSRDVDKLMIIDCMLPGKIMRLGAGARYMSARRPIKTTGADCEIRGGEYVAYDRASYATSLQVWLPGAKAGDPKAQTYVGEMFEQGLGTTPDYATALAWYRKAADQGYERAQMNLGSMYERGLGVEKNELEALNWYRKATVMGADELVSSSDYAALESEAAELREALEASEAEIARLKNDLGTSQRRLNDSQGRLDRTLLDLEGMRFEASRAQAAGGGDSADVAALRDEIRRKEQELAANREELAEIRVDFDRQQVQFTEQLDAQQDNQAATQALLDLQRDKLRSLETQVAQLTESLERRQVELRQSTQELIVLRQQLDAGALGEPDAGEVGELLAVIARQQAELEKKAHTTSFLEQELANQKQLLEAERLAFQQREQRLLTDADVMQVELQDLQRRLGQTEVLLSSYQQRLVENDRLIQRQEAEIVQQQVEIRHLRDTGKPGNTTEARALETRLGEQTIGLAGTRGEQAALIATVNNLEVELDRLRGQLTRTNQLASSATRGAGPLPAPRPRPSLPEVKFGEYHALIIGNNDYPALPKLETPVNDALAVARILEDKYGFKTQVLINADRYTILQTLNSFKEKLSENDNFLLYYAGHGTLDEKNDRGHWLPVDAHPTIPTNWISNVTITEYINTFEAKHIMVIADSCYSGTLTRQVRPALARGQPKAREIDYYQKWAKIASRTVLTSGALQPVMDSGGGEHSIFAGGLLEALRANDGILPGPDLFYEVYQRVSASSMNIIGQTPTFDVIDRTGDLGAPFFFVPG